MVNDAGQNLVRLIEGYFPFFLDEVLGVFEFARIRQRDGALSDAQPGLVGNGKGLERFELLPVRGGLEPFEELESVSQNRWNSKGWVLGV